MYKFNVYIWDQPLQWQGDNENGWMTLGPKNEPHSTTLKWWETTTETITPSMTTTINNTL